MNLKKLTLAACALTLLSSGHLATPQAAAPPAQGAAPGPLPLTFEVNRGQAADPVKFLARRPGHTVLLTPREALLLLDRPNGDPRMVRMQFEGARPDPLVEGQTPLAGKVNYLVGSDPRAWHTDIPLFARVAYRQLYPSVDLVLRGGHDALVEYDFVVAPGGKPSDIVLRFDGAERLHIDRDGDLHVVTADGELVQRRPVAYQKRGKSRDEVPSRFVMRGRDLVAFEVGDYDRGATLVIDPPFAYSTFVGGDGSDRVNAIGTDAAGKVYVTGQTNSFAGPLPLDFPTKNPLPGGAQLAGYPLPPVDPRPFPSIRKYDAFVGKFDTAQSGPDSLVYMTFFGGGQGDDRALAIAVDGAGRAHIGGVTSSRDLPLVNPLQTCRDASNTFWCDLNMSFLARLSSSGSSLEYASYLNGNNVDTVHALAIGPQGHLYVGGGTGSLAGPSLPVLPTSPNYFFYFPVTPNAVQTVAHGGFDAFITELDLSAPTPAQQLVYSTLLGGCSNDEFHDLAVDASGRVAASGGTQAQCTNPATQLPIANAIQPTYQGGLSDALVARINPAVPGMAGLVFSTFLGGKDDENDLAASGLALDAAGNIHLAGKTSSANFPTTAGAAMRCPGMLPQNAALYPCNPATGQFAGALPPNGVVLDGYLTTLSPSGQLLQSTFIGGAGQDDVRDLEVRADGAFAYLVGTTNTAGMGSSCAPQPLLSLFRDGFQATVRLTPAAGGSFSSSLDFWTYIGGGADEFAQTIAYDAVTGSVFAGGYSNFNTSTRPFPTTANALQPVQPGTTSVPFENGFLAQIAQPGACAPNLVVRKVGSPEPVSPGCAITYTIEVENVGVLPATQVVLTDDMPDVIAVTQATASQGTCSGIDPVVCGVGTLAVGQKATITLVGSVSAAYSPTQPPLVNTASATSFEIDVDPSDNAASWVSQVLGSFPAFSVSAPTVTEGNAGTATAVFGVTLAEPFCAALPFSFATDTVLDADVAAQPSQDFLATSGAFSIPAGATSYDVPVTVVPDTLVEPDELFKLIVTAEFTNPVSSAAAIATIVNDDQPPVVALAGPATADESSSQVYSFTVTAGSAFTVGATSCGTGTLVGSVTAVQDPAGGGAGSFTCAFGSGPDTATVSVQVQAGGAASNVAALDVAVANLSPVVTLTGVQSVESGSAASYEFSASDAGGDPFTLSPGYPACGANGSLVAGSLVVNASGGSFQCQFGQGPATSDVSVQVTDDAGATSTVATLPVDIAAIVSQSGKVNGNGNIPAGAGVAHLVLSLSCAPGGGPAHLQATIGSHRFKMKQLTGATCSGAPIVQDDGTTVPFNTLSGTGAGEYDKADGYLVSFTFVDGGAGQPDTAVVTVTDAQGNVVLAVAGTLTKGKIQAQP